MAGLKVEERRIGGATYRVTQLGFGAGRPALIRFARMVAPAVAELAGAVGSLTAASAGAALLETAIDGERLGRAFVAFLDRATEDEIAWLCETFAGRTLVRLDGSPAFVPLADVMEIHFAGKYRDALAWIRFALEVNFADFFAGLDTGGAAATLLSPKA